MSLDLTRPSTFPGPPPAVQPAEPTLQYAEVSNQSGLTAAEGRARVNGILCANFPGAMLGRSLLSPSKLSSLPLVMLNGLPLCRLTIAETDQPLSSVRVTRLKCPK